MGEGSFVVDEKPVFLFHIIYIWLKYHDLTATFQDSRAFSKDLDDFICIVQMFQKIADKYFVNRVFFDIFHFPAVRNKYLHISVHMFSHISVQVNGNLSFCPYVVDEFTVSGGKIEYRIIFCVDEFLEIVAAQNLPDPVFVRDIFFEAIFIY
jgi:hypothetical protein